MEPWLENAVARAKARGIEQADVALVLGSGLGGLVEQFSDVREVPYSDLPDFPVSTVPGHEGKLLWGRLDQRAVLIAAGRVHLYEGYSLEQITAPIRLLRQFGPDTLILTNAAGCINPGFKPGELMVIDRQINLTGRSILQGAEPLRPYLRQLGDLFIRLAAREGHVVRRGTYLGLVGPSYETPAEIRFFRFLGADAVGMSTIHEAVLAHNLGMSVLGISGLTNYAAGIQDTPLNHEEVLVAGKHLQITLAQLLPRFLAELN